MKLPFQYLNKREDDLNENIQSQKLEQRARIDLAKDLLTVYGDSILRTNIDEFIEMTKDRNQVFEFDSKIQTVRL